MGVSDAFSPRVCSAWENNHHEWTSICSVLFCSVLFCSVLDLDLHYPSPWTGGSSTAIGVALFLRGQTSMDAEGE
ncbi:hypothetical protein INT43_009160 [Umbelopsis isabellina]|uniref:Uncharacterized protein n=1 Tax=Mortierella isabellina TaxID=91625 RepID=A0A8H7PD63_MORIS|nr:hypothetical protein INT43_009160 [Umbelopsis isabellina]